MSTEQIAAPQLSDFDRNDIAESKTLDWHAFQDLTAQRLLRPYIVDRIVLRWTVWRSVYHLRGRVEVWSNRTRSWGEVYTLQWDPHADPQELLDKLARAATHVLVGP